MGCGRGSGFGVSSIMVGVRRVGLVGLAAALDKADASGLTDREPLVDLLVDALSAENYVSDAELQEFRTAVWREYLRHKGEDFAEFFSKVDVTLRGEPGDERDRFVELLRATLAGFELQPVVTFAAPSGPGRWPRLEIAGNTVVEGPAPTRRALEAALRKTFSDW